MAMKINRNELCPCGSGDKYKDCCDGKRYAGGKENRYTRWLISGVLILLLLITVFGVVEYFNTEHPDMEAYKCDNPTCNQIHYRPATQSN